MITTTTVDILIIGAGPAGLALANWFRNSSVSVLLIDKKPGPTPRGQAEGLKSTTNEIFSTFGIGPQIEAESWRLEEIAVWGPSNDGSGIVREQVVQDKVEELGTVRETILQQSRVEYHLLQNLLSHTNIAIRYSTRPFSIKIDESCGHNGANHPVTVGLVHVKHAEEQGNGSPVPNGPEENEQSHVEEGIQAKYVVGCDGAHSWLRKQLDVVLEGDLTDSVFGVTDLVPKTNFPDIRRVCYLRAATGTMLTVPRPNKEIRLYIPVESGSSALPDPKHLTFSRILAAAREIIAPYTLDAGSVSWWSAYRVGQRVGSHFARHNQRAFLVGDAVHTHSPKAGQGMNTSIQDAYNLGWKLRLVLQGRVRGVPPEVLLATYEGERRPVAQDLIAFDRGYLKLFSAQTAEFDTEMLRGMRFTTGLSIRYPRSCAVQLPRGVEDLGPSLLKADLVPGKRLQDFQAVYHADGATARIQTRMQATGAFRVIVFAGEIGQPEILARSQSLGEFLADSDSGLGRLTMPFEGNDSEAWQRVPIEVLLVHCGDRKHVELLNLHEVYRPWSSDEGHEYWRVFSDEESVMEGHGKVYERLELDRERGCCAVIRPDGYVGTVVDVDDFQGLKGYFQGVGLLEAEPITNGNSH